MYRIGSAAATTEWQQFSNIGYIGFDGAGRLYLMDSPGGFLSVPRIIVVDAAGGPVNEFGRAGDGPGEVVRDGTVADSCYGRRPGWNLSSLVSSTVSSPRK